MSSFESSQWRATKRRDSAQALHDFEPDSQHGRTVIFCTPTEATVVLGSAQSAHLLDPVRLERSGLQIAKRKSGGGLVVVEPDGQLWANVFIGRDDPLWQVDVIRAFEFMGEATARFLSTLGLSDYEISRGTDSSERGGKKICFAGLGVSEASVGGLKLTGLSQRRRRHYASFHFQCLLYDNQSQVLAVLNSDLDDATNPKELAVVGLHDLGLMQSLATLEELFLAALP